MFVVVGARSENRFQLKPVLRNKTAGVEGGGGGRIIFVGKVAVCSRGLSWRVKFNNRLFAAVSRSRCKQTQECSGGGGGALGDSDTVSASFMCGTDPQHMAATHPGPLPLLYGSR